MTGGCRDCVYYYEDEDRRKCMNKNRKNLAYYGGCKYFDDGTKQEEDHEQAGTN